MNSLIIIIIQHIKKPVHQNIPFSTFLKFWLIIILTLIILNESGVFLYLAK